MAIPRLTDTDDDGTGTTGTVRNNAWLQNKVYDTLDSRWSVVVVTSTGTQNNLAISDADFVVFNNASDLIVTGMTAPSSPAKPGKPLRFICIGAGNVYFAHQNASSTAANRLVNIATSGNTPAAAGSGRGSFSYYNDATNPRWYLQTCEQGAYITPAFNAAHFSGNGAQTWTVSSGNRAAMGYKLSGRQLSLVIELNSTTVGGTPNTDLTIAAAEYGGFTAGGLSDYYNHLARSVDAGSVLQGLAVVGTGASLVRILKDTFANWSAATATTSLAGTITFEVA